MEIKKELNNDELTISLVGELNTITSPQLEEVITNSLKGVKKLVFDFEKLDYISSAGLRVLLVSKKIMDKQGSMIVKKANQDIMDIFEMTGFSNILDFEN